MKALLVHGTGGHPEENWFGWLRRELEGREWRVLVPDFPDPPEQSLEHWWDTLSPHLGFIGEDTVLVGHSIGVAFALHVLERIAPKRVAACALASGFLEPLGIAQFAEPNATFVAGPFDRKTIQRACARFFVYHGDNDPYVPLELGRELAHFVGGELRVVSDGGHLNEAAGYTRFPLLLRDLSSLES